MANPSVAQPPTSNQVVDDRRMLTTAWIGFMSSLVGMPFPIQELDFSTGSPYEFTASVPGFLLIKGGTVSAISLTRGRITVVTGLTSGFIPMGLGDLVTTTFTVTPDAWFVPF